MGDGTIIVGLGNQGRKRQLVAGDDVTATVDPVADDADYRSIEEVPLATFGRAIVCTPDDAKVPLLRYLLRHGKHVLVEKPLLISEQERQKLQALIDATGVCCRTAYNHRFEPHLARLRDVVSEGVIGTIYLAHMFYGNGTARNVRNSPWRDRGLGVLADLGSHLLDLTAFLWGYRELSLKMYASHRFENTAPDHALFGGGTDPVLQLETTLLSWRNTFRIDLFGKSGSAHLEGLCKWGSSHLCVRKRVLPSGKPAEETVTLEQADPTWEAEYGHFLQLCASPESSLEEDLWISRSLAALGQEPDS